MINVLHDNEPCNSLHSLYQELNVPLLKIAGSELVAGISGESETRIRELFEETLSMTSCFLFLNKIDTIANGTTAQKEMEKRIVTQILSNLDGKKIIIPLDIYIILILIYDLFFFIRSES